MGVSICDCVCGGECTLEAVFRVIVLMRIFRVILFILFIFVEIRLLGAISLLLSSFNEKWIPYQLLAIFATLVCHKNMKYNIKLRLISRNATCRNLDLNK